MKKNLFLVIPCVVMLANCSWIMNQPEEKERIPQPPPTEARSSLPHNKTQKFEQDAALGGALSNPRR